MSEPVFTPAQDAVIIEHYPRGGSVAVAKLLDGIAPKQVVARVGTLRKKGVHVPAPPPKLREREQIKDGYDNVPYWCRQSTRKQICVEPRYLDGNVRHVAVRFEYDDHVEHSRWFKEKAKW